MNIQLDEIDSETLTALIDIYKQLAAENQARFQKGVITEREYITKYAKLIQESVEYIGNHVFDKLMLEDNK